MEHMSMTLSFVVYETMLLQMFCNAFHLPKAQVWPL